MGKGWEGNGGGARPCLFVLTILAMGLDTIRITLSVGKLLTPSKRIKLIYGLWSAIAKVRHSEGPS